METFHTENNVFTRESVPQLMNFAEVELKAGRVSEACDWLLRANNLNQENLVIFIKLAHCYSLLKNYDLSYTCYCHILQIGTPSLVEEA